MNTPQDPGNQATSEAINKWSAPLPSEWDAFTPFVLDDQHYFLAYNGDTGQLDIASVILDCDDPECEQSTIRVLWQYNVAVDPPLAPGLSVFRAFGDLPYFLAYQPASSGNQIVTLGCVHMEQGQASVETWEQRWNITWDSLMPLVLQGQPYYLAYDSGEGKIYISELAGDAPVTVAQDDTWGTGWTTFIPFDDHQMILAYNAADGAVKAAMIESGEHIRIVAPVTAAWESGWQALIPVAARTNAYPFFLAYEKTDSAHTPAIYRLTNDAEHGLLYIDYYSAAPWAREDLSVGIFAFPADQHHDYCLTYQQPVAAAPGDPGALITIESIPKPGYPLP